MRIVLDCRWIRGLQIDGIGRYTWNVTRELLRLDQDNEYILLFADKEVEELFIESVGGTEITRRVVSTRILDYPVLSGKELLQFRRDLEKLKPDLVFCPNYLTWPYSSKYKTIVVVHDLIPFVLPEVRTTWKWKVFFGISLFAKQILKRADGIISVSKRTRKDLVDRFSVLTEKINVIYEGVDIRFFEEFSDKRLVAIKSKHNLPADYILCVSRQQPYKNLAGLAKAYAMLPDNLKAKFKLVLTGEQHKLYSGDLQKDLGELIAEKQVVFTGFVDDEDLPGVYQAASLFVLPSLYEGFGLPILEAMASGCPVACSRVASLPEVGGDAVEYFNPLDHENMRDVLEDLLENDMKKKRMIEEGKKQVAKFTWAKTAHKILELF